jgi:hypothetical protein
VKAVAVNGHFLNSTLRYVGTACGLLGATLCILRPSWEIRLIGGQVMRPSLWLWEQPYLTLATAVSSKVNVVEVLLSSLGMLLCTYVWWWLGGTTIPRVAPTLRRRIETSPPQR